jgi:hypothetical protein
MKRHCDPIIIKAIGGNLYQHLCRLYEIASYLAMTK